MNGITKPRRPLWSVRRFDMIYLYRQSPYIIAWWSASFPGFGHFLLYKNTTGIILTLSEVIINSLACVNIAMVYSFCGKYEMAKQVIQPLWAFGYMLIYLFAIWDSYRCCLESNKLCELAEMEQGHMPPLLMKATGIQYLERKRPWTAAFCSLAFPGLGQIYNQHIWLGFYGIFWWWVYITFSHCYEGWLALLNGHNDQVSDILHPQWFMFMPSVIGGAVYHSFISAREQNRLFRIEQRSYIAEQYNAAPGGTRLHAQGGNQALRVLGTFEHSTELEQALAVLEHKGIERARIRPVLMNSSQSGYPVHAGPPSDRTTRAVELGLALGTASSVIGISKGFVWEWGPIIWGLLTASGGFAAGFVLFILFSALSGGSSPKRPKRMPEVTVMVQCEADELQLVQTVMWSYKALTVGVTEEPESLPPSQPQVSSPATP